MISSITRCVLHDAGQWGIATAWRKYQHFMWAKNRRLSSVPSFLLPMLGVTGPIKQLYRAYEENNDTWWDDQENIILKKSFWSCESP